MRKRKNIKYAKSIADVIISELEDGYTLSEILIKHPDFPPKRTIAAWRKESKDFEEAYRQASQIRAETWVDSIAEISKINIDPDLPQEAFDKVMKIASLRLNALKFLIGMGTKQSTKEIAVRKPELPVNAFQIINYDNNIKTEVKKIEKEAIDVER